MSDTSFKERTLYTHTCSLYTYIHAWIYTTHAYATTKQYRTLTHIRPYAYKVRIQMKKGWNWGMKNHVVWITNTGSLHFQFVVVVVVCRRCFFLISLVLFRSHFVPSIGIFSFFFCFEKRRKKYILNIHSMSFFPLK